MKALVAVKRVRGVTLLSPAWKPSRSVAAAQVSVAGSASLNRSETIADATMGKTD